MNTTAPTALGIKEIGPGVAEVYARDYQVGLVSWNPDDESGTWYATYANTDETVPCVNRAQALEILRLQHAAVQRFARSIRSIRPATTEGKYISLQSTWDRGYNEALCDVERLTREVVGEAPDGEGYTAITRPTN